MQVATIAQLVEHVIRNDGVVGSSPTGGFPACGGCPVIASAVAPQSFVSVPLGVIGNTPDSGSGESWFEPRRGNGEGWPSGLRRRPAKALGYGPRGFESHSLRFGAFSALSGAHVQWLFGTGGRVA